MMTSRKEAAPISALRPNRYPAISEAFGLVSWGFDFAGDLISITDMNAICLLLWKAKQVELIPRHAALLSAAVMDRKV